MPRGGPDKLLLEAIINYQRGRSLSKGLESQRQELPWVILAHNLRILSRRLLAERKVRKEKQAEAA